MWLGLLSLYIIISLVLHSLVCHTIKPGSIFMKYMITGTIVGCALMAHFFWVYGFGIEFLAATLVYAFISELYIFVFTFIIASISSSIVLRVFQGQTDVTELAKNYCGKTMLQNRFRRMQTVGLLSQKENALYTTQTGAVLVARFRKLRGFFKFDAPHAPMV